MAWTVDTCVLIDIAVNDPMFGMASARFLNSRKTDGLNICPATYVELSPLFLGDRAMQDEFLRRNDIEWHEPWTFRDTETAHQAWNHYIHIKRFKGASKRPLADFLIGAFACRFQGLITRNRAHFQHVESLTIIEP